MRIIIVGCGKVGMTIAEQLNKESHDITVIDRDDAVVKDVASRLDIMGIVGNGAIHSLQVEAGIEETDLLVAVTESDELNLLCCMIAKKAGASHTIARVRDPNYSKEINFIKDELGLAMAINPEYAAATEISRLLRFPSAIEIDTFVKGKVELLEFAIPEHSILDGLSLIEVSKRIKSEILVCTVERGGDVFIPNGNYVLHSGDMISIVASAANAKDFFKKICVETNQVADTVIVGGGMICYYLAEQLIHMGIDVKIIERDKSRCEELSGLLPKAVVIHGDATDQEVLLEEGVSDCASFVSLTGIDEGNIILSLFVKSKSRAKVITKINRISFDDIVDDFKLGSLIYPKYITAEYIVRYVRALQNGIGSNVETLYRIVGGKAEALEFKITNTCPLVGVRLEQLKLKDNILIGCINKKGRIVIPNGQSVIEENDTVIVVTKGRVLHDIKDILRDA